MDLIPPGASPPLVKPRSIDDVPILALTFWSKRYGDFELRRIAAQVDDTIKQTPDVSAVALIGGQRREVRITLNQARLAAYHLSPLADRGRAGQLPIAACPSGEFASGNQEYLLETGQFLTCADDVRNVVAGVVPNGQADLRARRRRSDRRRRGAIAIRSLLRRQRILSRGDRRHIQTQRNQRRHRLRKRSAAAWNLCAAA